MLLIPVLLSCFLLFGLGLALITPQIPLKCPQRCRCSADGRRVDCQGLGLTRIPSVGEMDTERVEHLDMRRNGMGRIDSGELAKLHRLDTLMLSQNRIDHIPENLLDHLPQLRHLHLGRNFLRSLPPLASVPVQLQLLDLHSNHLRHLSPSALHNIRHLRVLNLEGNLLQNVPKGMFENTAIGGRGARVYLDRNPWNCDCRIVHLVEFLRRDPSLEQHHHPHQQIHPAKCLNPIEQRQKQLGQLDPTELKCFSAEITKIGQNEGEILLKCDFGDEQRVMEQNSENVQWLYGDMLLEDAQISTDLGGYELLNNGTLKLFQDGIGHTDIGRFQCALNPPMGPTTRLTRQLVVRPSSHRNGHPTAEGHLRARTRQTIVGLEKLREDQRSFGSREDRRTAEIKDGPESVTNSPNHFHDLHHHQQFSGFPSRSGTLPRFTFTPRDRRFREGSSVQLNCEAIGEPKPRISWFFNSQPIEPSRKFEFRNENTQLVIYPFLEHDMGSYACEATNVHGRVKSDEARLELIHSVPPSIVEGPRRQSARPGQRVTFRCKAKGEPRPTITWFFNGIEIANLRGHFQTNDDASELTIDGVTRHDAGTFSCMAGNAVGAQTADAQLEVQSAQLAHLDRELSDQTLRSIVDEASQNIDRAISKTKEELRISTPRELLKHFKFVNKRPNAELSRAREIYEESLRLIEKHVELGLSLRPADMPNDHISFESVLSVTHIQTLMELSGCMAGQFKDACQDMCFHSKYRSYTGQCNNFEHPTWGVSQMPFLRLLPPIYENGFNTPVGWDPSRRYFGFPKPNPRTVSFELVGTERVSPHPFYSGMLMQWGQFVDHDLDFIATALSRQTYTGGARCNRTCENVDPCFNIQLPPNDPRLRAMGTDQLPCIEFERSAAICGSGETSPIFKQMTYREQTNIITSYLDGSQIYGSTEVDALDLRDLFSDHGLLRFDIVSSAQKPYLPFEKDSSMDCRRNYSVENPIRCFLSGDFRANEQVGLTAMHTIWLREHNRIATKLLELNPDWDGERIFQETRKIVGGMLQHITYNDWLPKVLGKDGFDFLIGPYRGYNPQINPSVSNAFATAAFRFGHTLISPQLERLNKDWDPVPEGPLPLHEAFFAPERLLAEGGVDPLLRGLIGTPLKMPMSDQLLNKELTEKLFHRAHNVSLDLAALNIQRGRDHGIPGYLEYRRFCNLTVPSSWEEFAIDLPNPQVLSRLRQLYGHPGNIDLWVGGIVEKRLPDALVGPTFSCIIADQFKRLREGDRFWYENSGVFSPLQLSQLRKSNLAAVICRNADDIDRIQPDVFNFVDKNSSMLALRACDQLPEVNLRMWMSCCDESCTASPSSGVDGEKERRKKRANHLYAGSQRK